MQPRMKHPVYVFPQALQAMQALHQAVADDDLPHVTRELVRLRASQINGCSVCVQLHARALKEAGESDERIFAAAAWRDTDYFTGPERAALALTEELTRIADRSDPVSDALWDEVAGQYGEKALAALLFEIAGINVWNRLNVAVRQLPVTA